MYDRLKNRLLFLMLCFLIFAPSAFSETLTCNDIKNGVFISFSKTDESKSIDTLSGLVLFLQRNSNDMQHIVELKENDSLNYDDLKIIHIDGGHKITMNEKGKRSGDLSFAEVVLQTPGMEVRRVRFYDPEGKMKEPFEFGKYVIIVKEVSWNGAMVKLEIRKK